MDWLNGRTEWTDWMDWLNGRTEWTDWMDWLNGRTEWTDWMDGLNGLTEWTDWMDGLNELTEWTDWMDWLNGRTEWTDWMDWLKGLTEWTDWMDWLNGLTVCTNQLTFKIMCRPGRVMFASLHLGVVCPLQDVALHQCLPLVSVHCRTWPSISAFPWCLSTAGRGPPSVPSLGVCPLGVCVMQDVALHQCRPLVSVWWCPAAGGSPLLPGPPVTFCLVVLWVFSLWWVAVLYNTWLCYKGFCCCCFNDLTRCGKHAERCVDGAEAVYEGAFEQD